MNSLGNVAVRAPYTLAMDSSVLLREWRTVFRLAAGFAVGVALVLAVTGPHASYYRNDTATPTLETIGCITPWNRFTDHVSPLSPAEIAAIGASNLAVVSADCESAIDGREHQSWALVALAVLLAVASSIGSRTKVAPIDG